jgi:hypothetical protein
MVNAFFQRAHGRDDRPALVVAIPKSRGRKPKKASRGGSCSPGSSGAVASSRLRMNDDKVIALLGNDQISPDLRIVLLSRRV